MTVINKNTLIQHISAKQGLDTLGIQIAFNHWND